MKTVFFNPVFFYTITFNFVIFYLCLFAFLIMVCPSLTQADTTLPTHIEVIYDNQNRITGVEAIKAQGVNLSLYNLNAPDVLLNQLSHNLPRVQAQARQVVLDRFEKIGYEQLKKRFIGVYQAIIKSTQYQLDRYPAIVFDQGKAVVYGITDIPTALKHYQNMSLHK